MLIALRWARRLALSLSVLGTLAVMLELGLFEVGSVAPPEATEAQAPSARAPAATSAEPRPARRSTALRVAAGSTARPEVSSATTAAAPRPRRASALEIYRRQAIYPPRSRPLEPHQDSLIHPNRRHERPRPVEHDEDARFVFTGDRYAVWGQAPLTVWLEVERDGALLEVTSVRARMRLIAPRPLAEATAPRPLPLPLSAEGGRRVARVRLAEAFDVDEAVVVRFEAAFALDGRVQRASFDVPFTPPKAVAGRFTGGLADRARDGSLEIDIGIEVFRPGYFVIDANLWSAGDEPVAWTRFRGELGPGPRVVTLRFFGKAIRDRGKGGPFSLGELRGARLAEGHDPDLEHVEGDAGGYRTDAYPLEVFSDAAWSAPEKQRRIEALERATLDPGALLPPKP